MIKLIELVAENQLLNWRPSSMGIDPAAQTYSSYQEKLFAEQLATQLPVAGMKKVNRLLKAQIIYP